MSDDSPKECIYDPLVEFMARFENVRAVDSSADPFEGLTIEESLQKHIVDGIKKNLDSRLAHALEIYSPLQIINDILLEGMKTVGELFGAGKMQLPFVLQSAEVMKTAVRYLEPHMERSDSSDKGSILLATVAGDVHDIGKNLVDIILTNNGYRVVNIGIKQPINNILDKAREYNCDVIGLSGLLVKSTIIMRDNLIEMNDRNLTHFPVILGGAALTRSYVEQDLRSIYKGRVFYAQDAFEGLRLMERFHDGDSYQEAETEQKYSPRVQSHRVDAASSDFYAYDGQRSEVQRNIEVPKFPFYGSKSFERFDIFEIYKYINLIALWRGQWQFKRSAEMGNPEFAAWLEDNARPIFERLQRELASVMKPRVVWGYFWCRSDGNDLIIYEEDKSTERLRFRFPRQSKEKRLCISDFFRDAASPEPDVVAFHLVTVGDEISKYERSLFESGDYQDYLYVHGMGVETAEALAEYWHKQIRQEMGIAVDDPSDMRLLFSAKYRGARYSFGYPACPNLEDQSKLFELLRPERIGVELSEEFMLIPEQSTSAIIVHHPEAKYFNIR